MSVTRNMKIRHKLILITMLTCIVIIVTTGATVIVLTQNVLHSLMLQNLSTQAEIMAENCKASVAFKDSEDAESTLSALRAQSSIVYACISTGKNKIFASYNRDKADNKIKFPEFPQENVSRFENDFLFISRNIVLDEETLGTVSVVSDLSFLNAMFRRIIITIALVSAMAFLLAYFLSSGLQRIISNPIIALTSVAKTISEEKEYSVRASKQTDDEIGLLVDSFNEMLEQIQQRDLALNNTNKQLDTKVKERTAKLTEEIAERKQKEKEIEKMHDDLVVASRQAGMAEVATNVLHNVGNILNSINVSVTLMSDIFSNSEVPNLKKVADMIEERLGELGTFLTEDQKGKHIPAYFIKTVKLLTNEQKDVVGKLHSLVEDVDHIKNIVKTQQAYARTSGVEDNTTIKQVIEAAIRINQAGLDRHNIQLIRQYAELGEISLDKQRVIQILVNLISNAKYALANNKKNDKTLTIKFYKHNDNRLWIEVSDNGIGISQENLTQIFRHGFTTKKHGHGFGLHSSALAAKETGGSLNVYSDGLGCGAKFKLELPFKQKMR